MMFAMSVHLAFTVKMIPRADATTRVVTRESEPVSMRTPVPLMPGLGSPSTRH